MSHSVNMSTLWAVISTLWSGRVDFFMFSVELCRRYVSQISNLLITLNSASNFIVYCLCSRNFRAVLLRRLRCVDCYSRRRRRRRAATGRQCGSPPGKRAIGADGVPMVVMPCAMPVAVASAPDFRQNVHWRTASFPRTAVGRTSSTPSRLSRILLPPTTMSTLQRTRSSL